MGNCILGSRVERAQRRAHDAEQRAVALAEIKARQAETGREIVRNDERRESGVIPPVHADEVRRRAEVTEQDLANAAMYVETVARHAEEATRSIVLGALLDRSLNVCEHLEQHELPELLDLRHRTERQQAGNVARRVLDDGFLEEVSRRHRAGEKWDAIAPDYSISPRRLRALVKKAGLKTRGRR